MQGNAVKVQQFLDELFEYEYCAECAGDTQHHTVCLDPFGNFFAKCDYPPSKKTNWEFHPVIKTYRKKSSSRSM